MRGGRLALTRALTRPFDSTAQSNVVLRALEPHTVVVEKQSPEQVVADRERAKEYSRKKARADASNVRRRHGRV